MDHQTLKPSHHLDAITEVLIARGNEEIERHQNRMEHLKDVNALAAHAFKHFDETGVFLYSTSALETLEQEGVRIRGEMLNYARSRSRPYIRAEIGTHSPIGRGWYGARPWVSLKVPCTKRLEAVVAPLLLVADKVESDGIAHQLAHPISLIGAKGTWEFCFGGEDGSRVFTSFIERCSTDPVCRIILKL